MVIRTVAVLKAKKEQAEEVGKILADGAKAVKLNEPGCIEYTLLQDKSDPAVFIFVEQWKDEAAVEAHRTAPHFIEMNKKLKGKMGGAPSIHRVEPKA
ncbi:hypothetical protein M427DRAFT_62029 [Gonapodya prolifera JEL478]|uniref:ABM domain-containing protein n=1 Tax=Gonapodya prolifera (strain JEL478) TaxID=1344416 RepID=A0A139A1T5_GONPJ|nr:hypothetical protein M427DRAFT_62029 [Gonapodya prolifera JEL478]|eukprot:KXS10505.1 hypothetical protein M427DRAFT_62029 [Gonapodya prolifera JEL478]